MGPYFYREINSGFRIVFRGAHCKNMEWISAALMRHTWKAWARLSGVQAFTHASMRLVYASTLGRMPALRIICMTRAALLWLPIWAQQCSREPYVPWLGRSPIPDISRNRLKAASESPTCMHA